MSFSSYFRFVHIQLNPFRQNEYIDFVSFLFFPFRFFRLPYICLKRQSLVLPSTIQRMNKKKTKTVAKKLKQCILLKFTLFRFVFLFLVEFILKIHHIV